MAFKTPSRLEVFSNRVSNLGKSKNISDLFNTPVDEGREALKGKQKDISFGYQQASKAESLSNDEATKKATGELDKLKPNLDIKIADNNPQGLVNRETLSGDLNANNIISAVSSRKSDSDILSEALNTSKSNLDLLTKKTEELGENKIKLAEEVEKSKKSLQEELEKVVWNPAKLDYSSQGILNSLAASPDPSNIEALAHFFKVNVGDAYSNALNSNIYNKELQDLKHEARKVLRDEDLADMETQFVEGLLKDTKKAGMENIEEDLKTYKSGLDSYFEGEMKKIEDAKKKDEENLNKVKEALKTGSDEQINTAISNYASKLGDSSVSIYVNRVANADMAAKQKYPMDYIVSNPEHFKHALPSGLPLNVARGIGIYKNIHVGNGKDIANLAKIKAAEEADAKLNGEISSILRIIEAIKNKPEYGKSVQSLTAKLQTLEQEKKKVAAVLAERPKYEKIIKRYEEWANSPKLKYIGSLPDDKIIALRNGWAKIKEIRKPDGSVIYEYDPMDMSPLSNTNRYGSNKPRDF